VLMVALSLLCVCEEAGQDRKFGGVLPACVRGRGAEGSGEGGRGRGGGGGSRVSGERRKGEVGSGFVGLHVLPLTLDVLPFM
jgi:hypothetical protein